METNKDTDSASETERILPITRQEEGERAPLDWIDSQETYTLLSPTSDVRTAEFYCLLVDPPALLDVGHSVLARTEREELILPVVLLVDESDERQVRRELKRDYPDLYDAINAVVTMPIAEYRFADRIETVLEMREQSRALLRQRKQLRAIGSEASPGAEDP